VDTELAECNFVSEVDLTRSAGGSGTAPVGPWRQQSRLSNRSIDDQIAYVPCITAVDDIVKRQRRSRDVIRRLRMQTPSSSLIDRDFDV
jgi:hypothetical protein